MGLAVAALAPGSVATAIGLWGTDEQQQTYLPAFTAADERCRPRRWPWPSRRSSSTRSARRTTAVRDGDGYVLNGVKSLVPRGADAELFVVGALLDGEPALFLVESSTAGLAVEARPVDGRPGRRR